MIITRYSTSWRIDVSALKIDFFCMEKANRKQKLWSASLIKQFFLYVSRVLNEKDEEVELISSVECKVCSSIPFCEENLFCIWEI